MGPFGATFRVTHDVGRVQAVQGQACQATAFYGASEFAKQGERCCRRDCDGVAATLTLTLNSSFVVQTNEVD